MSQAPQLPMPLNGPDDLKRLAVLMVNSGFFGKCTDPDQLPIEVAKASIKILAGAELGLPPVQAMQAFHVVEGKVVASYQLVGSLIQRSGKYRYEVLESTDDVCRLEFFEKKPTGEWVSLGISKFDQEDVKQAQLTGKTNHARYPRQMKFSRALTNGANMYCPSVFGANIYAPDDFNVVVDATMNPVTDENGNAVIDTAVAPEAPKQKRGAKKEAEKPAPEPVTEDAQIVESSPTTDAPTADEKKSEPVADTVAPSTPVETSADATVSATNSSEPAADPKSTSGVATAEGTSTPETNTSSTKDASEAPKESSTEATPAGNASTPDAPTNTSAGGTTAGAPDASNSTSGTNDARQGKPGAAQVAEILQQADSVGLARSDANGILMNHLQTVVGLKTPDELKAFKDKWTWADFDAVIAKIKAAKK